MLALTTKLHLTQADEENDLKKAKTLIEKGRFAEIMNYMLEKNQKLEQEIISWNEMWGRKRGTDLFLNCSLS